MTQWRKMLTFWNFLAPGPICPLEMIQSGPRCKRQFSERQRLIRITLGVFPVKNSALSSEREAEIHLQPPPPLFSCLHTQNLIRKGRRFCPSIPPLSIVTQKVLAAVREDKSAVKSLWLFYASASLTTAARTSSLTCKIPQTFCKSRQNMNTTGYQKAALIVQ